MVLQRRKEFYFVQAKVAIMDNKYFFYPNIEFDLDTIKEIVKRRLNDTVPELASHQRPVSSEPYLIELKTKYSFLSPIYNIYVTGPGVNMPTHIDAKRNCTLNIPIQNTENTYTVFYEAEDETDVVNVKERVYDVVNSKLKEIHRFSLLHPVIMNTKIPHGVIGAPDKTRVVMSWSALPDITYTQLLEQYGS